MTNYSKSLAQKLLNRTERQDFASKPYLQIKIIPNEVFVIYKLGILINVVVVIADVAVVVTVVVVPVVAIVVVVVAIVVIVVVAVDKTKI